ncbi:hypothetical protein [Roseomonas mucosa]
MVKRNALRRLEALPVKPHHNAAGVYEWMLKHHDRIAEVLRKRSKDWNEIAVEIGADGIQGAKGMEPNRETVRKTWGRVCRHLREHGCAEAATATRQPRTNRAPRHNQPPPSAAKAPLPRQPEKREPSFASPSFMTAGPGRGATDFSGANIPADETPEERIKRNRDGLREQFRRADAWLGPPIRRQDE